MKPKEIRKIPFGGGRVYKIFKIFPFKWRMDIKNFHFLYTRVEDALGFPCDIVTLPIYTKLTFSECQKCKVCLTFLYKIHKNFKKVYLTFCIKLIKNDI